MLMPKRVKYRRVHRGRMTGKATKGNTVSYGEYGLAAAAPAWITSNQIEAARVAMTRYIKRGGHVWIKIFPHKPVTEKPAETRMGSGKGSPEYWVAVVKPGRIMFEIAGVSEEVAKEALRLASYKLPIKCKVVKNKDFDAEAFSKINFKTQTEDAAEAGEGAEAEASQEEGTGGEQHES
jgi:large subunit ribosomal protein L16